MDRAGGNLTVAGPSGTGKSHFVEALAHTAIEADLRIAWFTLESLTATIGRAKKPRSPAPSRGSAGAT
jgi:DNA replication protein DnaC